MDNYRILETIFHLEWEICNKEKRLPTLEEIGMLLEAMRIVISASIKTSKEV